MRQNTLGLLLWSIVAVLFFGFLLAPLVILVAVSFNPVAMVFPPEGFTLKWYATMFDKPEFVRSALVSVVLGVLTAVLSTGLGVLASFGIQRMKNRARKAAITTLLTAPLFIPAVIVALALFQIIFMLGIVNNIAVLLAAHVVVTMPYPVRNVMAQLEGFDSRLEEAALTVGATPTQALRLVTLPLLKASIIPSLIITFVLSWNNYTVSVFLASKDWITLPLQLRAYLQYEYEPFVAAMSTVLILISIVLLIVLDRTVGMTGEKAGRG
jgi:putative spermidine/putrescine transport system permease protein